MVTVRRAAAPDAAALAAIADAAYRDYAPRMDRLPAPMTSDYAAAIGTGQVWVAAAGDQVIGLLVLVVRPDHLLIENIAVLPSWHRRGIGARLLALAEDQAGKLGRGEIRLYTNEAMTENLAYYPRHGYAETHRAVQDGFRRVFFRKRLTGPGRSGMA
jgi:GNAT superfamily N-acetyltransferase